MSKNYRLINNLGYGKHFVIGQVYHESYRRISVDATVGWLASKYPQDWQLIEEEMKEKNIILTLDQARKMYGKNTELDVLLLANFTKDELTKKDLPKSWDEIKVQFGYKLSNVLDGFVETCPKLCSSTYNNKGIFATKKQAKSALAMAQLSQLMAVYNDGWEFDPDGSEKNAGYAITRQTNKIGKDMFFAGYGFLAFKTAELRDEFLKNFEPLIKEYFMID